MDKISVRISGQGGQGVLLCGLVLGRAAVIYGKMHASLSEKYGPEARGGYSCAELVLSGTAVTCPHGHPPAVLLALSQRGYERSLPDLTRPGLLLYVSER